MPKASRRKRIVFCDCLDCQDISASPAVGAWEAAARQEPPPRSVVLCLEGFNSSPPAQSLGACCSLDTLHLPHFDNVARHGVTFCAAQQRGGCVSLLQQLLGVHADGSNIEGYSVPGTFQGMQCVVASTSEQEAADVAALGVIPSSLLQAALMREPVRRGNAALSATPAAHQAPECSIASELAGPSGDSAQAKATALLPPADEVCGRILRILRCHQGPQRNMLASLTQGHPDDAMLPDVDMLVLHVNADDLCSSGDLQTRSAVLCWVDEVLKGVSSKERFTNSVLVHCLVSFEPSGHSTSSLQPGGGPLPALQSAGEDLILMRPRQSWQFCGMHMVDMQTERPILVAARLRGSTRVDDVNDFQLGHVLTRGGQGCIPLERIIHEIAYKIARALKYGA